MDGNLTFDTNSLQTYSAVTRTGIVTNSIDHNNIPDKDVALLGLANTNASVIPQVGYPSKKITIAGSIIGSSQSDLDSRIDTFKSYFNGKNKNLDITYNGTTRRYIATATAVSIKRSNKALYADFTVEFVCPKPFGCATAATTAVNQSGRTLSAYNDTHTFLGTAPYQLPVITITYAAVAGGAAAVSFGNTANGQGIMVTDQTWVAGDVLQIDCVNKTVKRNGTEIDFLGAFPEFAPGLQGFTYSDGFTSRTLTELVTYNALYQ